MGKPDQCGSGAAASAAFAPSQKMESTSRPLATSDRENALPNIVIGARLSGPYCRLP
jgi:hypothetical protein